MAFINLKCFLKCRLSSMSKQILFVKAALKQWTSMIISFPLKEVLIFVQVPITISSPQNTVHSIIDHSECNKIKFWLHISDILDCLQNADKGSQCNLQTVQGHLVSHYRILHQCLNIQSQYPISYSNFSILSCTHWPSWKIALRKLLIKLLFHTLHLLQDITGKFHY